MKSKQDSLLHKSNYPDYQQLSAKMIVQLAAPHTWPAAILPVLCATVLASKTVSCLSVSLILALLCACIFMQSAVNTFNDYYDFIKGADNLENQNDPTDAVLVYNKVSPRSVFILAFIFLFGALLLGVYILSATDWVPLIIGLVGAVIIILYSAGNTPLSYLPVGEYVSALSMGGLIPLASYYVLTGNLDFWVLLFSFPLMCGIGLIMFTNNTCDIEKDREAKRKTQSVLLGRMRSRTAYHVVLLVWVLSIIVLVSVFFFEGLIVIPFMLLTLYPSVSMLYRNALTPQTRGQAMSLCLSANIGLGIFYMVALLFGGATFLVW